MDGSGSYVVTGAQNVAGISLWFFRVVVVWRTTLGQGATAAGAVVGSIHVFAMDSTDLCRQAV